MAFLDTEAQRNFISPDIARRLKLRPIGVEKFFVTGFNGNTAQAISPLYRVKILLKTAKDKSFEVSEVKNLIGSVHFLPSNLT